MRNTFLSAAALAFCALPAFAQPATNKKPITEDGGQPVGNNQNSRTAGENGPVTLDNFQLIQKLARFDRERIPERVVHARGVGAFGEFVTTEELSKLTKAKIFAEAGKVTPAFVRFSTVIHPKGSPEQMRDPRGFAVKLFTEEGNWDIVGNNLPVFFIRDAMKFPDMVHSLKPSPITNQQDPNRFFDFFSHQPESTHMLTFLFSDQGTPASLRKMDGHGVHAYKFVNAKGDVNYVKFHWKSNQGLKNFTAKEAAESSAMNHSAMTDDLYTNIQKGDFPTWDLMIQTLPAEDINKFDFNILDATKIWPGIPEKKVGILTLNRVPDNFFQSTEQVAYSPAMVVPGVEPSEDRLLQGRLFSYADTQRYRIGANYLMLPINRPYAAVSNNNQDGTMNLGSTSSDVNYEPSITTGGRRDTAADEYSKAPLRGDAIIQEPISKTQNFKQVGELYASFTEQEKANLITNMAGDLGKVKSPVVKLRMVSYFYKANADYGTRLAPLVGVPLEDVKKYVETELSK